MTGLAGHPWLGTLLGDAEVAELLSPANTLSKMLEVEAAWTRTVAPAERGEQIAKAIEEADVSPYELGEGTLRDGVPVPALVRLLKTVVSEEDHAWLHSGLTSQDVMDTSQALLLKEVLPVLRARLELLLSELDALKARDGALDLMAYTRMQPALPIDTAHRIDGWRRPLATLLDRWPGIVDRCLVLQWGGPVGVREPALTVETGSAFAVRLGLRDPGFAWHTDRGHLADLGNMLSAICAATGKIGLDISLLSQRGAAEISLAGGGSSSAMAHKKNPILAETCVTLARQSAVDLSAFHHALVHEQDRSGAAWMLEWLVLPRMLECTGCSLTNARKLLLQVDRLGKGSDGMS